MRLLVLACAGGAIGAGARHLVNMWFLERGLVGFPWPTFLVNITGSLLMGVLFGVLTTLAKVPMETRVFLATGILGGYTTFSAFSLDVLMLVQRNELLQAAAYIAGSVVLSILALLLGATLTRMLLT